MSILSRTLPFADGGKINSLFRKLFAERLGPETEADKLKKKEINKLRGKKRKKNKKNKGKKKNGKKGGAGGAGAAGEESKTEENEGAAGWDNLERKKYSDLINREGARDMPLA